MTCSRKLMGELMADGGASMHPTRDIFHGMVSRQKRAMSSSDEGALLIDELTEWLEAQIEADPRERHGWRAAWARPSASRRRSRSATSCRAR